MLLSFSELYKDTILNAQVLIVCGKHTIFNSIAIDRLRNVCKSECFKQLGMSMTDKGTTLQTLGNAIDLDTFMTYHNVPPFIGRWFCYSDISTLTTKQLDFIQQYIKNPSKYGVLVLEATEYSLYKDFLHNRTIKTDKVCHLLKLSYPNKTILKQIILEKLQGISIADRALDLFIMRMGEAYDDYDLVLSRIQVLNLTSISYDDMKKVLTGIEHFNIDDFLKVLLKPPRTAKTSKKKITHMMYTLMGDLGAQQLLKMIAFHVDQLLELRTYINKGYIPGEVKISLSDFKDKLEDGNVFKTMSDYVLSKKINLALTVSQRDLLYLKLMILQGMSSEKDTCEKTLYVILSRALLSPARLSEYLGCRDIVDKELIMLNHHEYTNRIDETIHHFDTFTYTAK